MQEQTRWRSLELTEGIVQQQEQQGDQHERAG